MNPKGGGKEKLAYIPMIMTKHMMEAFGNRKPNAKIVFERNAHVINAMRRNAKSDGIVTLSGTNNDWDFAELDMIVEGKRIKAASLKDVVEALDAYDSDPLIYLPTADGRLAMIGADGEECVEILDTGAGLRVTRLDGRAWDLDPAAPPKPEMHATLFDAIKAAERMTGVEKPRMCRQGNAWLPA